MFLVQPVFPINILARKLNLPRRKVQIYHLFGVFGDVVSMGSLFYGS